MAITKYIVIQKNLEAVINYAKNGEKTENGILVSGINCLPENAYYEMNLVKKSFHKEKGRLGYHIIQSFNDDITPEECNRIGVEFANSLWGDKYQVIVCTHTNTNNVHNHIIVNSVSFIDGSKYHNSNVEIALMKQTNDDVCIKHGLSIVDTEKSYTEYEIGQTRIKNFNRSSGKMALIKKDIDEAIRNVRKYQSFVNELAYKGYYIKCSGNSLSVSTPYFNRNIRLSRAFGEEYSYKNIKNRIYYNDTYLERQEEQMQNENHSQKQNKNGKLYKVKIYNGIKINEYLLKTSSFYRLYVHYMYLLGRLPPTIHYEERTPSYYKELDKFNKLNDELNLISDNNLTSIQDVKNLKSQYFEQISILKEKKEENMKLYSSTKNEADKTILKARISNLSEDIAHLNSKMQTCRRIVFSYEKGEKEESLIQERFEINKEKSELEIKKNYRNREDTR